MAEEKENYADEIDRANQVADTANREAVESIRRLAAPEQDPDDVQTECVDCGEEIQPERLALLRCRCFDCQSAKEKRDRLYARY